MSNLDTGAQTIRFGVFELSLRTGELRKAGLRIKLQDQPLKVLTALLENAGEIVTREELQRRIWPTGSFGDFDHALNVAVAKLRTALCDSAENPHLIETFHRRGYRFIASVEVRPASAPRSQMISIPEISVASAPARESASSTSTPITTARGFLTAAHVAGLLVLIAGAAAFQLLRHRQYSSASGREFKLQQLTADSSENAVTGGAISPDEKYLAYANVKGVHIKLIGTDQLQDVPTPDEFRGTQVTWNIVANWIGGGTGFLANATPYGHRPSVWAVPAIGGPMRKIRDDAFAFASSRDGSKVAFGSNLNQFYYREIWMMKPDGSDARKVFDSEKSSTFAGAEWSPDGQRLAYVKWYQSAEKGELSVESRNLNGGAPVRAISIPYDLADWVWAPDGRIITSFPDPSDMRANTCNFWETRVDSRSGQPLEQPKQMTNWSGFCVDEPSVSADGKRLAFRKVSVQSNVYSTNLQADGTAITDPRRLTLNEGRNYPVAWTPDSKAVVIMSDHNGKRQALTYSLVGDAAEPIAADLGNTEEAAQAGLVDLVVPHLSPDGAWILYVVWSSDFASSVPAPLMRVPIRGGPAQVVLYTTIGAVHSIRCARAPTITCLIAERTPDHSQLIFTTFDPLRGRVREAARFDTAVTPDAEYVWDVSPDGTRIAIVKRSQGSVHLLFLSGHAPQKIVAKDWGSLQGVNWAADGKGLFLSALTKRGSAILHVDLNGEAHLLREFEGIIQPASNPFMGGSSAAWAVPSPDGRHLAICSWNISANMWMLEGF